MGVAVGVAVGVTVAVAVAVGVGVGVEPPVIVKFESEISKKMLSSASTFTLAVVVATLGIVRLPNHRWVCSQKEQLGTLFRRR